MAARIAPTEADVKATFERINYWTREGLLKPQEEHPGTGRTRAYGEDEVRKARVLDVLTTFGVGIRTLKAFVRAIDVRNSTGMGNLSQQLELTPILVIDKTLAGDKGVRVLEVVKEVDRFLVPLERTSDGILAVNLARLWRV
jgi:DNA-binding transcriptional MerR regulator